MTPEPPSPVALGVGYYDEHIFGHTKEQLIEYGKQCAAATREECAKVVERDLYPEDSQKPYTQHYNSCIKRLAEIIRSGT